MDVKTEEGNVRLNLGYFSIGTKKIHFVLMLLQHHLMIYFKYMCSLKINETHQE